MKRHRLKCGGKTRKKAIWGEIIGGLAGIAGSAISSIGSAQSAEAQTQAIKELARSQRDAIQTVNANNNKLQQQNIDFTKRENEKNRQRQKDIQATLQMLAGQQNLYNTMDNSKMQVRYGGRPKKVNGSSNISYGGANTPFKVTDGGGAMPVNVDNSGYGLYEVYGNDHDHYHRTSSGKYKSGVGFKFPDGSVVEGEGNQNSNQGEYMYVTPNDAMFISKHSINGFNPAKAVNEGLHPEVAFALQEQIKDLNGYNDDGSRVKSLKRNNLVFKKLYGGTTFQNINKYNIPGPDVALYNIGDVNNKTNNVAKYGTRRSMKKGGNVRQKAGQGFWDQYNGAIINSAGNLIGAGLNFAGNYAAGKKLGNAYTESAKLMADAYSNLKTIDPNIISKEDYDVPSSIAAVRYANTNVNPQLERIRRTGAEQKKLINKGTLSSAAQQQKLGIINDRLNQSMDEQYAYKDNQDEDIKEKMANLITSVSKDNADRKVIANKEYLNARLSLAQHNNAIENQRILGRNQSLAEGNLNAVGAVSQGLAAGLGAFGDAFASSGSALGKAMDNIRTENVTRDLYYQGASDDTKINIAVNTNDSVKGEQLGTLALSILNSPSATEAQRSEAASRLTRLINIKSLDPNTKNAYMEALNLYNNKSK